MTPSTVVHESAHHEHRLEVWPVGYLASEDVDGDTLRDAWEVDGWDWRTLTCEFEVFHVDCELGSSSGTDLACFMDWSECEAQKAGAVHIAAGAPCESIYKPADYCGNSNFSLACNVQQ